MRKPECEENESPAERLLAAILGRTAGLEGAACRGKHELFDPPDHDADELPDTTRTRHIAATHICETCPVLDRCRAWVEVEPNAGAVLAATLPEHRGPGRPRKDAAA